LNELRALVDPIQAGLIGAHVTLCREHELTPYSEGDLETRIREWPDGALSLTFGPPVPSTLHGVLLPCKEGAERFGRLRKHILGPDASTMDAHITLAHPRNPKAVGNAGNQYSVLRDGLSLTLGRASVIEQTGDGRWAVLREMVLGGGLE